MADDGGTTEGAALSVAAPSPRLVSVLVLLIGVSSALHVGKLPAAIPLLQREGGVNLVQAGLLLSMIQLAGLTTGLLVGAMADRKGLRRVMLVGLGLLSAGSLLGALAPDARVLMVSRLLEGAGFLMAVLPAPGLLRRHLHEPAQLSRALGIWGAYMPLGTALALLSGVPLISWAGWRVAWVLVAVASLASAALLYRWIPDDPPSGGPRERLWPSLRSTLKAGGPWWVALGFLFYSGQWLAVIGFLPTVYAAAGLSGMQVASLSALAAFVNVLGNLAAGRLAARGLRPGVVMVSGFVAMGLGSAMAFGLEGRPVMQYGGVLLFSALGGLIPGTLFGAAVKVAPGPGTVSTTVGWMQQFSSLGQFLGPPLVAWWVLQVGGWQWTWGVTAASSLAGVVVAVLLQRTLSSNGLPRAEDGGSRGS